MDNGDSPAADGSRVIFFTSRVSDAVEVIESVRSVFLSVCLCVCQRSHSPCDMSLYQLVNLVQKKLIQRPPAPGIRIYRYTLRKVRMSGQYKYRRHPSACKKECPIHCIPWNIGGMVFSFRFPGFWLANHMVGGILWNMAEYWKLFWDTLPVQIFHNIPQYSTIVHYICIFHGISIFHGNLECSNSRGLTMYHWGLIL